MAQPGTFVVDIETVGQDLEGISPRAKEILLNVEPDDEARRADDIRHLQLMKAILGDRKGQEAVDSLGLNPDTLASTRESNKRQRVLDMLGLDPCTGRIICIGVHSIELDRSRAYCQADERELLANFWHDMGQFRPQRFITFNGKSFDFPYINMRSAILEVPIPRDIVLDTRRFSTERHFDVREILTNYERYKKGTLEYFCEIFGVPSPKDGISGANVGEYFKAGKLEEIAQYCLGDCKATAALYLKLKPYYR
jgi:DNA polymerase elongation subunit (family B)